MQEHSLQRHPRLPADMPPDMRKELVQRRWPLYLQPVLRGGAALSEGGRLVRALTSSLKQAEDDSSHAAGAARGR